METSLYTALWRQFGAAIDMLENALLACPTSLWEEPLWSGSSDHSRTPWLPPESARLLGADIAVEKTLPVGGGLGGGSSDAATVLLVLNRLWDLNLRRAELSSLALTLGADVPLFVFGECALGEGVGERLTALVLEPAWYLVLVPQVAVSTREIFSDAALTRDTKQLKIPPFLSGQGRNDLEPVVTARHPDVAAHLAWLRQRSAGARMTGSGACV